MRLWKLAAMGLVLSACNGTVDPDTDTDTDIDTDTDTDIEEIDADGDGFNEDEDCDDTNADIFPGADEACDGVDNDCDGELDNGFDADNDGFRSLDCADGTDCDDTNADVNPDATEVPYDGIDQDCVDGDLDDVDMDGYASDAVGGPDCDDTNPDISPDAEDILKDGIDQDCDGSDNIDADGDGFGDEDFGGDDCDDEDPNVNPGRLDFYDDDLDTNCDKRDGKSNELAGALVSIVGATGVTELLGANVVHCDIDDDGLQDLIVAAPFSSSYRGQVGVWYGANTSTWNAEMTLGDADAVLRGSPQRFFGSALACGDIDGNGTDDLAVAHGEINYSTTGGSLKSAFDIALFYGDGTAWSGMVNDTTADAILERELGVNGDAVVVNLPITIQDLSGDGAGELIMRAPTTYSTSGSDEIEIVLGAAYTGTQDFEDIDVFRIIDDEGYGVGTFDAFQGDGEAGQWFHISQPAYDNGAGLYAPEGKASFGSMPDWTEESYNLSEIVTASFLPTDGGQLGLGGVVFSDFNGDETMDVVLSAPYFEEATYYAGGVWLIESVTTLLAGTDPVDMDPADAAVSTISGADPYQMWGLNVADLGDLNGDGYRDIAVREGNYDSTKSDSTATYFQDIIWVLSGEKLMNSNTGDQIPEDSVLLDFWYEEDLARSGFPIRSSDFDGDGQDDFSIAAQLFPTPDTMGGLAYSGKVYVYVSGINGW